jgi:archaemetzincin
MSYIDIVPIGDIEDSLILPLQQNIFETFKINTRIRRRHFDLISAYDSIRNQYNSSALLLQLINDISSETLKVLGVTEMDLFIPIFTFLFGEAQLNGKGALVSVHRLQNQFYGLPGNEELLKNRLLKESIHELGHTFGLIHCFTLRCVMNTSTYVEEIDQKLARFCRRCEQGILHWKKEKNIF